MEMGHCKEHKSGSVCSVSVEESGHALAATILGVQWGHAVIIEDPKDSLRGFCDIGIAPFGEMPTRVQVIRTVLASLSGAAAQRALFPQAKEPCPKCGEYHYGEVNDLDMQVAKFTWKLAFDSELPLEKLNKITDWFFNQKRVKNALLDVALCLEDFRTLNLKQLIWAVGSPRDPKVRALAEVRKTLDKKVLALAGPDPDFRPQGDIKEHMEKAQAAGLLPRIVKSAKDPVGKVYLAPEEDPVLRPGDIKITLDNPR